MLHLHKVCSRFTPNPSTVAYLTDKLLALEDIAQSPQYHPEGDALYHSLQVFQLAYHQSSDPELWAAALFHDIGKANSDPRCHSITGAEDVAGILTMRIQWLIRHHLDLLKHPARTKRQICGNQLNDLQQLRRWDLAGRQVDCTVIQPEQAIKIVCSHPEIYSPNCR